ncbi:MAG: hypothetical protein HKP56_07310 [Anderseniella sp.]|nr:hypothetical protein [Anderseniella sp.]
MIFASDVPDRGTVSPEHHRPIIGEGAVWHYLLYRVYMAWQICRAGVQRPDPDA